MRVLAESSVEHMEMTTYVIYSRRDGCLALGIYLEQDHFSRIEGEINMRGTFETIGCRILRTWG